MKNEKKNEEVKSDQELNRYFDLINDPNELDVPEDARRARKALELIARVAPTSDVSVPRGSHEETQKPNDTNPVFSKDEDLRTKTIGFFEVISEIGSGGHGVVYLANDTRLDRHVALKLQRDTIATSPDLTSRFIREGKAAATLTHPNIIPIFESGQWEGTYFHSSEYVEGETLDHWVASNDSLSFSQIASIVSRVAEAISHAHQRGILHRDIKPGNILMSSNCEAIADKVRVADFGLAKFVNAHDEDQTVTGAIIGTPAFMSPEQARNQPGTERSDIYSIGAVLYQLLVGTAPFAGDNLVDTLKSVVDADPIPPRNLDHQIPKDLQAICLKCLEKSPDRRYADALQLRDDLEAFIENRPVVARNINAAQRFMRWVNRNPVVFGLQATIVIGAVGFGAWVSSERNRAFENLGTANQAIKELTIEKELVERNYKLAIDNSRRKSAFVRQTMKQIGKRLRDVPTSDREGRALLEQMVVHLREAESNPNGNPFSLRESALTSFRIGEAELLLGNLESAIRELKLASANFQRFREAEKVDSDFAMMELVNQSMLMQALNLRNQMEDTIKIGEKNQASWDALSATMSGDMYFEKNRSDADLTWAAIVAKTKGPEQALEVYERTYKRLNDQLALRENDSAVAKSFANACYLLAKNLDANQSLVRQGGEKVQERITLLVGQARSGFEQLLATEKQNVAVMSALAKTIYFQAKFLPKAEQESCRLDAIGIQRKIYQRNPSYYSNTKSFAIRLNSEGLWNFKSQRTERSLEIFSEAELILDWFVAEQPQEELGFGLLADVHNNKARALIAQKNSEAAISCLKKAVSNRLVAQEMSANPRHAESLARHFGLLAGECLKEKLYAEAADAAINMAESATQPKYVLFAATTLAVVHKAVGAGDEKETEIRVSLLGLLKRCCESPGFKNEIAKMAESKFGSVVDDPEFRELIFD